MSILGALRAFVCALPLATIALPAHAADAVREIHGMADAFAVPGIAIAWGVLRGDDESTTVVALRIVADPARFAAVAVTGTDPFTQATVTLVPQTPVSGRMQLQVPRAHFAEFPRTEVRFQAAAPDSPSADSVVVYFLGVPDTTPEFASRAALDASLADRISRASSAPAGNKP